MFINNSILLICPHKLFISERSSTYDQRQKDLEMTIKLLKEAIKNANLSVRFEYAFVGLDDAFIYDFRKDLQRSSKVKFMPLLRNHVY